MAVTGRLLGATGLVVTGVLAAALVGQLPAFGVTDHVTVAKPSSAQQRLICPGPVLAIGADAAKAAAITADGRPGRVMGTSDSARVTATGLGHGNVGGSGSAPRLLTAKAADTGAGAIAGAQSETVTTGDAVGLAATDCTVPVSDAWFAAGSTTTGRTTVLALANASSVDAQVTVRLWTENGPIAGSAGNPAGTDIVVPAKSRKAVSLASLAPGAGGTVLHITTTGARVGAAIEQRTVRGLESGGVDLSGPTTAPATSQVISGLRIAGAAAVAATAQENDYADLQPVVRVLIPGTVGTDVKIVVRGAAGSGSRTLGRLVAPGVVTDFPVTGLADGVYSVQVTAARPIVIGARVSVVGDPSASTTPQDITGGTDAGTPSDTATSGGTDTSTAGGTSTGSDGGLLDGGGAVDTSGAAAATAAADTAGTPTSSARGIDLAWIPAGDPLGGRAAVAVANAPSPMVSLANPTAAAITVQLVGPGGRSSVVVPASGTVSVAARPGIYTLSGAEAVRAAVSYAGPTAIAAYAALPADQGATSVRISH